ncbi:MAG: NAD(P)H-hydrate epimerase [Chloroflexi bacterium]|nr:MAG: NAD(P)H-hydrate epimerase [Chloroflexota bacterium]
MEQIPYLTTDEMREVDRLMIEVYGIELIQMMENAGRCLAELSRNLFLAGDPRGKQVVVLAGRGGNGGGGLVCARRLYNWGADVVVCTTHADGLYAGVPAHQLAVLRAMGVRVITGETAVLPSSPHLIIDAIIGYGLSGNPHGTATRLIQWATNQPAPILSLDTPSGLDTTTGLVYDPAIQATATMTLALPKKGLRNTTQTGALYLADISVPPDLYVHLGLDVGPVFAQNEIIRIA